MDCFKVASNVSKVEVLTDMPEEMYANMWREKQIEDLYPRCKCLIHHAYIVTLF